MSGSAGVRMSNAQLNIRRGTYHVIQAIPSHFEGGRMDSSKRDERSEVE